MQIIYSIITFILIFTTFYSYGFAISNKIYKVKNIDFFFKILVGYIFIGVATVIFHFFFKIGNLFSFLLITGALLIFIYYYSQIVKKDFLILIFIIPLCSFLFFGYSNHPIDTNMYHHPYVSYLKSEKIIFAIANIQFRFGHISFLQYVQSAITNDHLHTISLASINIIFYICFIYFVFKKIIKTKKLSFIFLINILFTSFFLIKFARYREYGNDLIPLLVCTYFLILIIEENKKINLSKKDLMNLSLPFIAFMFAHKISYVFAFLIFLPLFNFSNFKFIKEINLGYILVFLIIIVPWLIKNYVTTSCFAYPVEISCFSNSLYELDGIANPSKASWLTEIWAKGFIDHPQWKELDLNNYISGFNWVPTWLSGHFVKILEIISPLLFIIFLFTFYILFRKKVYLKNKKTRDQSKNYQYLWFTILLGLSVWFYKAPIFRYGSFYIISFVILSYIIILNFFFSLKDTSDVKFFKIIFFVSLSFFLIKNGLRIKDSDLTLFPKTISNQLLKKIYTNDEKKIELYTVKSGLCYYSKVICSHEIPQHIKIKKLRNYYLLVH